MKLWAAVAGLGLLVSSSYAVTFPNYFGTNVTGGSGSLTSASTVGGSPTQIQYNSGGGFAGISGSAVTAAGNVSLTGILAVNGTVSATNFVGNGSGLTGISGGGSGAISLTTYTTSGAKTFTTPVGTTVSTTYDIIIGAAGGGSGGPGAGTFSVTGGGSPGGVCEYIASGLAAGSTISINVGAGGGAGSSASNGSNGGSTTLIVKGSSTMTAPAGRGSATQSFSALAVGAGGGVPTADCTASPSATTIAQGLSIRGGAGESSIALTLAQKAAGGGGHAFFGGCASLGDASGAVNGPGCGAPGVAGSNTSGNTGADGFARILWVQ